MSVSYGEWGLTSRYPILHMIIPSQQISALASNSIYGVSANCTTTGFTRNSLLQSAAMPIYVNKNIPITCSLLGGGIYLSEGATSSGMITLTFSNNGSFGGSSGGTPSISLNSPATSSFATYNPGQYTFPGASNDIIAFCSTVTYSQTAGSWLYVDLWGAG